MSHNDTFVSAFNSYLLSGQFTTTVKTSIDHSAAFGHEIGPTAITYDGTNPGIAGEAASSADKLYLISGVFSSTLKDSQETTVFTAGAMQGGSLDNTNTTVITSAANRALYLSSGKFSVTIKTSASLTSFDTNITGVTFDETNTTIVGNAAGGFTDTKLWLLSGQFSTTIKDSEDISGIDTIPEDVDYDGTNTLWIGDEANKAYLTSGQFTATIKTSVSTSGLSVVAIATEAAMMAVHVAGTAVSSTQADIIAGGGTIILTLETGRLAPTNDTWGATMGANNAVTQALIDNLTSSGAEANGWNNIVRAGLTFSDVTRDSDSQVTILLPAFGSYSITISEVITATVPATTLTGGNGPFDGTPVITVSPPAGNNDTVWSGAGDEKLYLQSGQFTSTIKDSEDVSAVTTPGSVATDGTDCPWMGSANDKAYLQSGQFTSTVKTSLDMTAVDSDMNGISVDETPNTPVMGNSANKMFLMSGQFSLTVKDSESTGTIDLTPTGISEDGTNTPWSGQLNLTTFTDTLYLQSGQFTSTLKTSLNVGAIDSVVNDLSFSNGTGDTPMIGSANDKLYLLSGQFSTTIHDSEDVSAVDSSPNGIDVNDRYVASGPLALAVSGTIVMSKAETDIVAGADTIVLIVSGDTWVATLGADNAITQALIDGLLSDKNQTNGWNNIVKDGLTAAQVTRTSDTIVTITLPAFSTYDISGTETITVTAPATALSGAVALVGAPTFDITATPPPRALPRRIAAGNQDQFINFISPDGTVYAMNTPHQFGRWVISDSGKGTPPINYIDQRGPFQDGATVKDFFLGPRVIQMLIRQEFRDRLDWWDGRAALLDILRPNRQTVATGVEPFLLEWCLPDGTRRRISVFIAEGPRFEPRQLRVWDEHAFQEVLRFIAHDPLFFDPTEVSVSFSLSLGSHLVFPITFPIQFGSGIVSDSVNVTYSGTWETFPIIEIAGPLENPIITNTTTDEKLEFTIDIPAGRTVTIDLTYGNKSVVDDLGTNLIGKLSADSDLATFHIAPIPEAVGGVNVITLTGLNPTGSTSVILKYFTRFFGI